ncbi:hypothetical protein NDU88_003427 [Pleurodeles waltl]|uniref:Uncharacterized protein n=1 Tax=Pleurodeles waltl TaxID=8319 RepID=A0AAV7T640_PLEWA|nr:hypothetical protein NDU88_003427 [Pleurodeles waltl]
MPESVPQTGLAEFLEQWLREGLAGDGLSPFFAIERAHRVPARPPPPGTPPRPIIAKLLHYRDRDYLLHQSRTKGDRTMDNHKVRIFPDFSREVQKQRATFSAAKQKLSQLGLQYGMMFPAKLRVVTKEGTQFFTTAEEVWQWLDQLPQEGNGPPGQVPGHGRKREAKRKTAHTVNSPSHGEMQTERRKAMEAAASLNGSDRGSQVQSAANCEPSDSEHESESSRVSDGSGPVITPGTSDCII